MSMAGIKAGKAFILIEAIDKTSTVFNKVGGAFRAWGSKMQAMGQNILFKTFAAMTPAALGLAAFKDFDDKMQKVKGRTSATAKQMQDLRTQARGAGKDLGYTSREVSALMDELAQKGFNPKQIKNAIGSTLDLARSAGPGTDVDTTQAADVIGTMLNSYGMDKSAENVKKVADIFALAANRGNYSLEEFKETMKNAATVGREFDLPIEDLVAMASQLRDVGIESESVGIALRNIVLRMSDHKIVEKFNERLKALTGTTTEFLDKNGDLIHPAKSLEKVGKAMKDLGTGQRGNLMDILIGDKAIVAGLNLSRKGELFKSFRTELEEATDFAHKSALEMNQGVGGAWRRFAWGVEQVALSFGESLKPALIDISHKLMSVLETFSKFMDKQPEFAAKIVLSTLGVIGLGTALLTLGFTLKMLAPAFFAIGFGIKLVLGLLSILKTVTFANALGWMAIRGAMTAAAMTYQAITIASWALTTAIMAMDFAISTFILTFTSATGMLSFFPILAAMVSPLGIVVGLLAAIGTAIYLNRDTIFDAMGRSIQWVRTNLSSLASDFSTWFSGVASQGKDVGNILMKTFNGIADAISIGDTQAAWDVGLQGLSAAWTATVGMFMDTWAGFTGFFVEAWFGAVGEFKKMWSGAENWMAKTLLSDSMMGSALRAMAGALGEDFEAEFQALKGQGVTDEAQTILDQEHKQKQESINAETAAKFAARKAGLEQDKQKREEELAAKQKILADKLAEIARRKAEKDKELADAMAATTFTPTSPIDPTGLTGPNSGFGPLKANDALVMNTVEAAKKAYENSTQNNGIEAKEEKRHREVVKKIDEEIDILGRIEEALSVA